MIRYDWSKQNDWANIDQSFYEVFHVGQSGNQCLVPMVGNVTNHALEDDTSHFTCIYLGFSKLSMAREPEVI